MSGRQRVRSTRRPYQAKPRRWRRLTLWILGGGALVAAGLLFDVALRQKNQPRMDASNLEQVAGGRSIYGQACSSCHGESLQGQPNWRERQMNGKLPAPPLDASGRAWRHSDKELFAIVKAGSAAYPAGNDTDMPAFGEQLSDEEIAAALAYVKSVWSADIQARQARRSLAPWRRAPH